MFGFERLIPLNANSPKIHWLNRISTEFLISFLEINKNDPII